ncbi:hypothetical protein OPT61_g1869 [Boeremia exigua]|uniref:Uncharacterized protein n=1 Tax=Boeremia exigua TaxID=749465 RepID=A0ACC2INJ9_9PLEO|nr:hypothetical protein OPT61_g1869 [Boeremia exigua]
MATDVAVPNGDVRAHIAGNLQRAGNRHKSNTTLGSRRHGISGKPPIRSSVEGEDELDLAGDLPPKAMAAVFGQASSRPKLSSRNSSRRSISSAHGIIGSGPPSIATSLSFHTARSSAVSYFTANLEILENRSEWLAGFTQDGIIKDGQRNPGVLKNTDRWLQTVQTLKRLGLETIEDPKKLEQAYFQYVCDAMKRNDKIREAITTRILAKGPVFSSEWMRHLDARGILTNELDWSGRGEHVEYASRDESKIPLRSEHILGHGFQAIVECVRCRRVRLARKTIFCSRSLQKTEAISEVEHLQKLRHSHIVRVVGTYTIGKRLAILLYPAAQWNLTEFMAEVNKRSYSLTVNSSENPFDSPKTQTWSGVEAITTFFGCISNAVLFIHTQNIRHMDLKPGNLLVRPTEPGSPWFSSTYKIYIADFGIARAYKSAADSETDSRVPLFTPRYAAPEVVEQETRGFSSDIFSVGCIFVEMMATILSASSPNEWIRLKMLLGSCDDNEKSFLVPYHMKTREISQWFQEARERYARNRQRHQVLSRVDVRFLDQVPRMLHLKPECRPTATELEKITRSLQCAQCNSGSEPFEAAEPLNHT